MSEGIPQGGVIRDADRPEWFWVKQEPRFARADIAPVDIAAVHRRLQSLREDTAAARRREMYRSEAFVFDPQGAAWTGMLFGCAGLSARAIAKAFGVSSAVVNERVARHLKWRAFNAPIQRYQRKKIPVPVLFGVSPAVKARATAWVEQRRQGQTMPMDSAIRMFAIGEAINNDGRKLAEVAGHWGISIERVRQIAIRHRAVVAYMLKRRSWAPPALPAGRPFDAGGLRDVWHTWTPETNYAELSAHCK